MDITKVQYNHNHIYNHGGEKFTVALEVPTVEELLDLQAQELPIINTHMGMAKCSKLDPYTKSIGRAIALKKMEPVTFELKMMYFSMDKGEVTYDLYSSLYELRVTLRKRIGKPKVYLIGAVRYDYN